MNKGKRYLSIIVLIFSITSVITCNKLPFNGNQKSIDILNGLGVLLILNSTNSKLDSKFQSSNAKSFYRKNGSRQYQDLFIDYTLKEPKLNSEIIEAYIGNEDEIIYDQQNNKVIGHFDKKIDEFETNSILFSHSDINKKLKIFLTLQQEGKIVSIQEFKTTGVTPPVIPPNSILLPSILVKTTLPYTTHPYQAIEVKFENPPNISEYTSLYAYLGRPSLITLEPNNFDVSNYLQVAYYNRDFHKFLFTTPELTSPFKIIVVGVTASGKGNRIIDTVPPIPIDHCSGSENIPATFGNCDSFCLKVDLIGNQMEFTSKVKINNTSAQYTAIELYSTTPTGGIGPTNFSYQEFYAPLLSEYSDIQSFDVTTYTPACVAIQSSTFIDDENGFRVESISKKVKVP